MKVLFLTKRFFPHIGGVEKHVEKIVEQLQKKRIEVIIVTEQYAKNIRENEVKNRVKIVRIPVFQTKTKSTIWKWIKQARVRTFRTTIW